MDLAFSFVCGTNGATVGREESGTAAEVAASSIGSDRGCQEAPSDFVWEDLRDWTIFKPHPSDLGFRQVLRISVFCLQKLRQKHVFLGVYVPAEIWWIFEHNPKSMKVKD